MTYYRREGQLFETMDEMDDEVKTRFFTTFQAIREKFSMVFQICLAAVERVVLTDPDDLLNTGIEIEKLSLQVKNCKSLSPFWW